MWVPVAVWQPCEHLLLTYLLLTIIWSSRYVYLKDKLDSVQRRLTKRLKSFGHISHAARLDRLKAETLELLRFKSAWCFLLFGVLLVLIVIAFFMSDCESVHTRGLDLRLYKEHCNVNCRLNAFVCRNINVWNRLPAHVVNSDSVAVFKRRLACVNLVNFCS